MTDDPTAPASGATSPAGDPHPGQVEFVDRVEDRSWTEPAGDVPQGIAWAEVEPGRWVPVARVVSDGAPGRLEITRFDAAGDLVDVTVQRPSRPPPADDEPTPMPTPTPTPEAEPEA
jgi:hypothetical protein